jgi:hypothetical protein
MQLVDGKPVYAATDLVGFLACEHLTIEAPPSSGGTVAKLRSRFEPARSGLWIVRQYG